MVDGMIHEVTVGSSDSVGRTGAFYAEGSTGRNLLVGKMEIFDMVMIAVGLSVLFFLLVEHHPEEAVYSIFIFFRIGEGLDSLPNGGGTKKNITPSLRHVHVYLTCRSPCPVIFRQQLSLIIALSLAGTVGIDGGLPLYPAHSNAKIISGFKVIIKLICNGSTWNGHFHCPSAIGICGIV